MLIENKTNKAITRIQFAYSMAQNMGNDLVVAYSGGKDSDVLIDLAIKSGVPFRAEHNHTTVDAPETVHHIREIFEKLDRQGIFTKINYPDITMWDLIVKKKMPPTRIARYCCEHLKESKFDNQHLLLGVRWAESNNRKNRKAHEILHAKKERRISMQDDSPETRRIFESCINNNRVATNPIIDWSNAEVWQYAHANNLKMNPLYQEGYHRVGCIGCPMSKKGVHRDFARYPKYKMAYIRAFDKMLVAKAESRRLRGKPPETNEVWKSGESLFNWWINPDFNPDQISLFEGGN